jgi:hypothetical protein
MIDEKEDVSDEQETVGSESETKENKTWTTYWARALYTKPYDYLKIRMPCIMAYLGRTRTYTTRYFREQGHQAAKYLINIDGELFKQEYKQHLEPMPNFTGELVFGLGNVGYITLNIHFVEGEVRQVFIDGKVVFDRKIRTEWDKLSEPLD